MKQPPEQKTVEQTQTPSDEELMENLLREKYVSVKLIREPGHNVGVVTKFSGFKTIDFKDKETGEDKSIQKPLYEVEIGGHGYEFTLSQSQAREIFEELKSRKPLDLIGKKLKFTVEKAGSNEYVGATIVP